MGSAVTIEDIRGLFERHAVTRVKLGAFDVDCTLRGKYVSVEKFYSSAAGGMGFCDVIFGWDIADALYDNVKFTGWHTGYPDASVKVDLSTFRTIPWEPGTAFFLLDFVTKDGRPLPIAPRQVLQAVLAKAAALGYRAHFAAEYEFWMFRETAESLRAKSFRNLTPLSPGMFGYSVLRASENREFVLGLFDQLAAFSIPLEGLHAETGPGVYEAAIAVEEGLQAADRAALFKTAVKELSARHGLIPTFMAKWNADLPGSSGHLHQSLWNGETNLFHADGDGISGLMKNYIGGLVESVPAFAALLCPTINSYKRTVPGTWAPVNATWAVDNRTTAIRAIPGGRKSTRVELRLTGADINPYLAMAASLAAGLDGIVRQLEPPAQTVNAYSEGATEEVAALPRSLAEATKLFRTSQVARNWLGDDFVDHYAATRDWEVRQFEKAVTDWELARYLESI